MSEVNKKRIAYAVLILAIVLAGVLGVQYPLPSPPDGIFNFGNQATSRAASIVANGWKFDPATKTLEAVSGAALTIDSGATATFAGTTAINGGLTMDTNKFTVADTSGNVNTAGTLSINSVSFSGPIKFGAASTVVSGTTVAHGLATTPTMVILTPVSLGGFTTTVPYIMGSNTTSFTVGVADNFSFGTLYWMAGK